MKTIEERLAELDKLRGTGYWDFHYDCLWHRLYKLLLNKQAKALSK
jgi:hypothetical protein